MDLRIDQKIEQLVVPNGMPHPDLIESILKEGDAAIPPLIEFLNQEVKSDERGFALGYVIHLLGSLVARQAIPALVNCFSVGILLCPIHYGAAANTFARLDAVDASMKGFLMRSRDSLFSFGIKRNENSQLDPIFYFHAG